MVEQDKEIIDTTDVQNADREQIPQPVKKQQYKDSQEHKMSLVYRFFCWCSGARLYILKKCPTDYNTFFGIGIIILLTGFMATISGSYAFYTVFQSTKLAIVFGIFWGILIFFLDWYLVSSLKKQNKKGNELLMSVPRLILAFFLAVVISKPIELKLFEKEINNQIASSQLKGSLQNQEIIDTEFKEIEELKNANKDMATQLKYKEIARNNLFDMVVKEAEGQSVTGKIGKGPVYREKKEAYNNAEKELSELKSTFLALIQGNNERIQKLQLLRDNKISKNTIIIENNDGFLARMEAMSKLSRGSDRIAMISMFILLLFICIESAPLLVKLISSRGAYDEYLDVENFRKKIDARRQIAELRVIETKQFKIQDEKTSEEFNIAVASNNDFINKVSVAQAEINQAIVDKWRKQELDKIDKNIKDYIPKIEHIFGISKLHPATEPIQKNNNGSGKEEMVD